MNPRIGLLTPVKAALGEWLTDFHAQFLPDTQANAEWASRAAAKAMAWAPARMVDAVEDMLKSWSKNDNSGGASTSAFLPAIFVATAADYTETPGEAGRPLLDPMPISFPDDPQHRSFRVRVISADLRAQVVVAAGDTLTAMSMLGQLCTWASARPTLHAAYVHEGFATAWPVKVVGADRMAVPTPLGEQVCILSLDLTLRAGMPLFYGPAAGEPSDGASPPGFPVTAAVNVAGHRPGIGAPTGVSAEEWAEFIRLSPAGTLQTPASDSRDAAGVVLWPLGGQS